MWQKIWFWLIGKKKTIPVSNDNVNSSEIIAMPVEQLKYGMYISKLDIPWLESPFKFQGFTIETDDDLHTLREFCQIVYIDVNKQKKWISNKKRNAIKDPANEFFSINNPPEHLGTFAKEISRAEHNYKEAGILVAKFMDNVAEGGSIDGTQAKHAVSACVNSVLHSPDAFLWLTQLKNKDQYTAQHSLNVCVLSILLGRHIGLSELQLNHVGLCGMMHDMGKMLIPLDILNKPAELDSGELEVMRTHTTLGYELLKSSSDMYSGAINTALTHHEHIDGKGYPRRIKANRLSHYSNVVAIADMYDAITSDRVYKKGQTHHQATKVMLDRSGSHLDPKLTIKFIESLGVYPAGCFVELSNGSIAQVIEGQSLLKLREMERNNHPEQPGEMVKNHFSNDGIRSTN
ncbi:HD-GYP domain-containing protein [Methyloprofundus sp.]|uniref:HD-GYP domain-containing protein n=1 Tax=Methyloprofundus sp. TaxID=2020875 RepID=UPI003D0C7877